MKSSRTKWYLIAAILSAAIFTSALMQPAIFEVFAIAVLILFGVIAIAVMTISYMNEQAIKRTKRYDEHIASGKPPDTFEEDKPRNWLSFGSKKS